MNIKILWYKEGKYYHRTKLNNDFQNNIDILNHLMSKNILRAPEDEESANNKVEKYKFDYCGIIMIGNFVIKCYPKYIETKSYEILFPLVLKSIIKYKKRHNEYINIADPHQCKSKDKFSVIVAIIEDYRRNGLYHVNKIKHEQNGQGETDWQSTIDKYDPFFKNGRPIYFNRDTLGRYNDEENFFRQLHISILKICYDCINKMGLADFYSLPIIQHETYLSNVTYSDKYTIRLLRKELSNNFVISKRNTLLLLISFLENKHYEKRKSSIVSFGTNAMYNVWEDALKILLNNELKNQIGNIKALPDYRKFCDWKSKKLIDIIEKPRWELNGYKEPFLSKGLMPDAIAIEDSCFTIYDAKYYTIEIGSKGISHQPELESVSKQFLYHMAYQDFLDHFMIKKVKNIFLLPHEGNDTNLTSWTIGKVHWSMIMKYKLVPIDVYYVNAEKVWDAYVNNKPFSLEHR